jgi:hypothetical protein
MLVTGRIVRTMAGGQAAGPFQRSIRITCGGPSSTPFS